METEHQVMNDVMVTGNEAGIVRVYSLAQCMHETWVQTSGYVSLL